MKPSIAKLCYLLIIHSQLSNCACLASSTKQVGSVTDERPNVVLFITDDQSPFADRSQDKYDSAKAFGFNGEQRAYTPEIDRLAQDGIIFTRAYVAASVCSPSRYTALTGRYAGRCAGKACSQLHPPGTMTRVENNTELESNRLNLAKLLQTEGYRTGFVGKCHVVDHHLLNQTQRWESEHGLLSYSPDDNPRDPEVTARMQHNHKAVSVLRTAWQSRMIDTTALLTSPG